MVIQRTFDVQQQFTRFLIYYSNKLDLHVPQLFTRLKCTSVVYMIC